MCGGSTRHSLGGAIAILKPVNKLGQDQAASKRELSLRLMAAGREGTTNAIIAGLDEGEKIGSKVLIHQDGDLRLDTTADSTVLHHLTIPANFIPGTAFELNVKLNLGVDIDGVIGRRISLISGDKSVGMGIIGWN